MTWSKHFSIGTRSVGDNEPAFIIAEIGSNHNQQLDRATELIALAAEAGADAVKFQSLKLDEVHHEVDITADFSEFYRQIELNEDWYGALKARCDECGVEFMSSPTYYRAIKLLSDVPASALKIASAQFGIHPWLVAEAAAAGLPVIASTGLVTLDEIVKQLDWVQATGNRSLVLLHCVSRYPTELADVHLAMIQQYRETFDCLVGFSDHTMSIDVPALAVSQGACVIEKHITVDRTLRGPDHHFALEPTEFKSMVQKVRDAESAIGGREKPAFTDEEVGFREAFVYRCVPEFSLKAGERLHDIEKYARRAKEGIDVRYSPLLKAEFAAKRPIAAGELIRWDDIEHVS